jgi:carbohydrate-selective porin OprB
VSVAEPELSKQGLYLINWFSYAPGYDSAVPFYFHTGLVYEGLIPNRDKDRLGVIFGYGSYSEERIQERRSEGLTTQDTMQAVMEMDYYVAINQFLYTKPFWQYVIRPNANGQVPNANIFGMEMGVTF